MLILKDHSRMGYLVPLCAAIGGFVGWTVIGPDTMSLNLGHGKRSTGEGSVSRGISTGLKGAVFFTLYILLSIGLVQMLRGSVRGQYDGPMEAVTDIVGQALSFAQDLAQPELIGAVAVGAALIGIVASWAGAKWQ